MADNIKKIRERSGLSQREFAEQLGVSHGVIMNLEYGKLQNPERKLPLFRLISEKYKVPVDWILSDDPGELPPMGDAEKEAYEVGSMIANDPVVQSFLAFWAQRTDAEKEVLQKAINDFADQLKKNMAE